MIHYTVKEMLQQNTKHLSKLSLDSSPFWLCFSLLAFTKILSALLFVLFFFPLAMTKLAKYSEMHLWEYKCPLLLYCLLLLNHGKSFPSCCRWWMNYWMVWIQFLSSFLNWNSTISVVCRQKQAIVKLNRTTCS